MPLSFSCGREKFGSGFIVFLLAREALFCVNEPKKNDNEAEAINRVEPKLSFISDLTLSDHIAEPQL